MRALMRSAVLWIAMNTALLPASVLAQSSNIVIEPAQQTDSDNRPINPLFQNPLFKNMLEQLHEQNQQNQNRPPGGGDDVQPPQGNTNPPSSDDVQVTDRQGPTVEPLEQIFQSKRKVAVVRARITDPSGVARAVVINGENRITMTPGRRNIFTADVPLAPHYRPVRMTIRAWDRFRNPSDRVPIVIRRLPVCGLADGINVNVVRSVQRSLAELNRYGGAIDGLAGPNTCRGIAAEDIDDPFNWPRVAELLEARVARLLIGLRVEPPQDPIKESNPVWVRVIDPRNTNEVAWVRMLIDGVLTSEQQTTAEPLRFSVTLAEGTTRKVTFLALNRRKDTTLAQETISVTRPGPLGLSLSGAELIAGVLESEAAQVIVTAELSGAETGRIFFDNPSAAERSVEDYVGRPVQFRLTMPAPGEQADVRFAAQSDGRTSPVHQLRLQRLVVNVPDAWVGNPAPGLLPAADPVLTPLPGQPRPVPRMTRPAFPADSASEIPPTKAEPLPDPVEKWGNWRVIAAIGVLIFLGVVAWIVKKLREPGIKTAKLPPTIRVKAVPDEQPDIEVAEADLPGLVLTVHPARHGDVMVEFKDELEGADP